MSVLRTILPILGFSSAIVPENKRVERLRICVSCPTKKYFETTGNCMNCGCFVREKVELKKEFCPEGHWNKE